MTEAQKKAFIEKRIEAAKKKILTKVRNKETNKVCNVLTNFDIENRTRHFFNPDKPDEEYPIGLYEIEPTWPYEEFGIECGDGWKPLIQPIIDYIQEYNKDKPEEEHIEIHQIKEKFAGLRVYLNFYNTEVRSLIERAEEEAEHTCEICGTKENVGMTVNGWLTTKCKNCVAKTAKHNNKEIKWRYDGKVYWVDGNGKTRPIEY